MRGFVLVKYIDILIDRLHILQCLVDNKSLFYYSCSKHMFDLVGFFFVIVALVSDCSSVSTYLL